MDQFFERALDFDRDALMALDHAAAVAIGAAGKDGLGQRFAAALPGHFDKAKFAHAQNRAFGGIVLHRFFQAVEDAALVFARAHVDKVADDKAADIADAQLSCDLFGCFHVDVDEGFFDVRRALLRAAPGIDVDRVHRFGPIKKEIAAARQPDFAPQSPVDLAFDIEPLEHGSFIAIEIDLEIDVLLHIFHKGVCSAG